MNNKHICVTYTKINGTMSRINGVNILWVMATLAFISRLQSSRMTSLISSSSHGLLSPQYWYWFWTMIANWSYLCFVSIIISTRPHDGLTKSNMQRALAYCVHRTNYNKRHVNIRIHQFKSAWYSNATWWTRPFGITTPSWVQQEFSYTEEQRG